MVPVSSVRSAILTVTMSMPCIETVYVPLVLPLVLVPVPEILKSSVSSTSLGMANSNAVLLPSVRL